MSEALTALGGLALLVQAFRSLGVGESVKEQVRIKQRERGYDEPTRVESFVLLNGAGGECLEDFEQLRKDAGLAELIGPEFASPEAARQFLYAFHEENQIEEAKLRRKPGEIAYLPEETTQLQGLGLVNREWVRRFGLRCSDRRVATVDRDATSIESRKQEALRAYEGERGYQPMLAVWAEMEVVLADEFRDGNGPARMQPLTVAKAAFAALPETVKTYYFRGDSGCHESGLVNGLRNEQREDGPRGCLGFGISARMSAALQKAVLAVPEEEWKAYGEPHPNEIRECAEVPFVPTEKSEPKDTKPLRYVGIRIRKKPGGWLDGGAATRHFAIVANIGDWSVERLIQWHREKAGTIEAVHDVLKNELAAGVLPCKYFGAHAAWLRLTVIAHNLLTAMQRLALPAELLTARPQRLRFLIFNTAGRVVHPARKLMLRLARSAQQLAEWIEAFRLLPLRS